VKFFLLVAAGATLWGCYPLFLRPAGLTGVQSAFLVLCVMALPAPFTLSRQALGDRRATLALVFLGLGDAINIGLFFAALQRGPLALAVLTHYLAPLLLTLAAPWVLRERRSARALLGTPLTLLGLGLLLGSPQGAPADGWTALLGAASALFYAANVLAAKRAIRTYSPMAVISLHSVLSALALLLAFGSSALPPALDAATLQVLTGGAVCGLFGNILFNTGLRHVPAAAAGALTYLEPLTAALLGQFVFGETLGPWGLLGGLLVLASGAWVASEPRTPAEPTPITAGTG
jgi:drug/metabolite transporter (DMT)-like permease